MAFHTKAFWAMVLFLAGVALGSAGVVGWSAVLVSWLLCGLAATFLLLLDKNIFAVLIVFLACGVGYYSLFEATLAPRFTAPIGRSIELGGMVKRVARSDTGQQVDVELSSLNNGEKMLHEYKGVFRLYAEPFPELHYGDVIRVTGTLKPIEGASAGYYAKEGIGALMSFPKTIEVVATKQGSRIFAVLYGLRDAVRHAFERSLSGDQATLMTGLVIGKSSGFSKEFSEKLRITGTTHLVALSGYNIKMVLDLFLGLFAFFLVRKRALWLAVAAVVAFVVMTGAEASVVRAAIMATLMVLAQQIEKPHSVRNAITFTALVMVLVNPRLLAFDIGFQLSFAALIGIVYVKPAIDSLARRDTTVPGFLGWKENLATTFAAQLAVLPILLFHFGFLTPIGIVTNVLLLSFIPFTMLLGAALLVASALSSSLAFIVAIPAKILLGYELGVINFFSRFDSGYDFGGASTLFIACYYALLLGGILWVQRREKRRRDSALPLGEHVL